MDEKKVADYFVVAGLNWNMQPLEPLEEVIPNEAAVKDRSIQRQDPVVELAVINRSFGDPVPCGFRCIEYTPTGFPADLNHGSIRAPEMFLCYRRGRDLPPIVDIGILYESKDTGERLLPGCEVIYTTPQNRSANVNNSSGTKIFVTFRRASPRAPCDILVVTEICVILPNKGEVKPHAHCIVNKNLNKGVVGSAVFLCYKKSMTKVNCLTYKPSTLGRYPLEDLSSLPLPQQVAMFCLPMGAVLESWDPENQPPTPVFSTFILTTGMAAEKVYGAAVMFHEIVPQEKVELLDLDQKLALGIDCSDEVEESPAGTESGAGAESGASESVDASEIRAVSGRTKKKKNFVVHQNKSICLLSRSPFFDTFKKFLFYIYRLVFSKVNDFSQQIPIEKHIAHFLTKIPMPSIQRPRIMIQLSCTSILLAQPDETPLPKSGASFIDVLRNLGPTNCVLLLLSALMEHKILVHSLRPAVLTSVAEAIAAMIFPLHWQCPYIPLCPLSLSYVLHSPTPFIVGIDSRYFDTYELPPDVTCVDLDTNTLTVSEDRKSHTIKTLPKKPAKLLKSTLEKLYERLSECLGVLTPTAPPHQHGGSGGMFADDSYFNAELTGNKKRANLEVLIREAYLTFMATILKGYNHFLLPITNAPTDGVMDLDSLFDVLGFVKSRDKAYHKFYALLMKTQAFSRFIEERSFVSDKDSSLAFFDDCLERVGESQDAQRLIEIDETQQNCERTVLIMGPEPEDPDQPLINYPGYFPELDPSNFPLTSRRSSLSNSAEAAGGSSSSGPAKTGSSQGHHLAQKVTGYNSPMVCRTQHEMKQSHKIAMKHANVPSMWAKFLAWHCYSLWFIHLSSYSKVVHSKSKLLRSAYEVLVTMQSAKLQPPDEVCYRVLMQLCGIYHLPVLAVKVLFEMRRRGIQPNAITYGFYNKAVLESKWPTSNVTGDQLWSKLRNVVMAVAQFKKVSPYSCPISAPSGGTSRNSTANNAVQSRPFLPHSNSESDPDRQSVDSCLDCVSVETSSTAAGVVTATAPATIVVNDLDTTVRECQSNDSTNELPRKGKSLPPRFPRKLFNLSDHKPLSSNLSHVSVPGEEPGSEEACRDSGERAGPRPKTNNGNAIAGNRQRAKSTSEVGKETIGIVRSRSRESMSAGGLSDRGYSSLNMEETKDANIFSSQSLSSVDKEKEMHKSVELTTGAIDDHTLLHQTVLSGEKLVAQKSHSRLETGKTRSGDIEKVNLRNPNPSTDERRDEKFPDVTEAENVEVLSSILTAVEEDGTIRPPSVVNSVRVPVTQNDPLGFFNPNPTVLAAVLPQRSEETAAAAATSTKFELETSRGNDERRRTSKSSHDVLSQSSQSSLNVGAGTSTVLCRDEDADHRYYKRRQTLASSASTATECSQSEELVVSTPPPLTKQISQGSSIARTPGWVTTAAENMVGGGSELLGSALKMVTTKFSRYRDAIGGGTSRGGVPTGDQNTGSISSLNSAESSSDGSYVCSYDRRHTAATVHDSESGIDVNLPPATAAAYPKRSSVTFQDGATAGAAAAASKTVGRGMKVSPLVSSFWTGLGKTLQKNEMLKGLALGLSQVGTSMKVTVKETLSSEAWTLSNGMGMGAMAVVGQDWCTGGLAREEDSIKEEESDDDEDKIRVRMEPSAVAEPLGIGAVLGGEDYDNDMTIMVKNDPSYSHLTDQLRHHPDLSTWHERTCDPGSSEAAKPTQRYQFNPGSISSIPSYLSVPSHNPEVHPIQVEMSTLNKCTHCTNLLYDEEIMAGWTADDSNLNTSCQFCSSLLVPFINIYIKDYRPFLKASTFSTFSQSSESILSCQSSATNQLHSQQQKAAATFESTFTSSAVVSVQSTPSFLSPANQHEPSLEIGHTLDEAETTTELKESETKEVPEMPVENQSSSTDSLVETPETLIVDAVGPRLKSPREDVSASDGGSKTTAPNQDSDITLSPPVTGMGGSRRCASVSSLLNPSLNDSKGLSAGSSEVKTGSVDVLNDARNAATAETSDNPLSRSSENEISCSEITTEDGAHKNCLDLDPLCFPYLSPLVLRKELENLLLQEGDSCFDSDDFLDDHPILYWNLVWYFKRLDVASHLPLFISTSKNLNKHMKQDSTNQNQQLPVNQSKQSVSIRAMWDNVRLHDEHGPPLYVMWSQAAEAHENSTNRKFMMEIVESVMNNDVAKPLRLILAERARKLLAQQQQMDAQLSEQQQLDEQLPQQQAAKIFTKFHSIYRDVLFLSFAALGRENIDIDAFDKEYKSVVSELPPNDSARLKMADRTPRSAAVNCRKMFKELDI